jgi:hypothetical protein
MNLSFAGSNALKAGVRQRTFRCEPIQWSQWKRQLPDGANEPL